MIYYVNVLVMTVVNYSMSLWRNNMIGTLSDIRNLYSNESFILGYVCNTIILPKEVTIKEDLTVWHDGACIINGMKDQSFYYGTYSKMVLEEMNLTKDQQKVKQKKRL